LRWIVAWWICIKPEGNLDEWMDDEEKEDQKKTKIKININSNEIQTIGSLCAVENRLK